MTECFSIVDLLIQGDARNTLEAIRILPFAPLTAAAEGSRKDTMEKAAIARADYEKLGAFYLGREYDIKQGELQDDLVMYDSKDLVTHGVVLGMTGSGKTGLCISLLEEAAMDNIPAIIIDPKGDISNLMLTFPDFQGSDFRPWINEDDALKKGRTPDEHAEKTAKMWEEGIASWGQGPERVREFKDKIDINIFTPGSRSGIPVSILSSLDAPPFEIIDDGELLGERIESTVSSLLSLIGVDADPIQSEEAVLLSTIFNHAWSNEQGLTLESLIRHIQKPPFGKVGIIDVESFYPSKKRQALALKFNSLLASPGFSTWLEGPALDINKMMYQDNGQARISIFSIAHLNDSERMFFVSILLNQMLGWMRAQSGTTSLRALLYMDEIYGYLPPTANPPSKKPMMTMLKQARAFGLGVLLATQNPVDLDYKALSNIGTWWLGRLQTERDKARVLDGLEGAAASQDGSFDRGSMEELLAGLGSRVFLMNNVHEDAPVVFHVRWVMSYLRGPLTRRKIKELMDPKREVFTPKPVAAKVIDNPMGMPSAMPSAEEAVVRPVVGTGVTELFAPVVGPTDGITYRPHLLRQGVVHFSSTKCNVEGSREVNCVSPMSARGIDWKSEVKVNVTGAKLLDEPQDDVHFDELPGYAMNAKNYKSVGDEYEDWLYRNERVHVFHCADLKEYANLGESEGEFRARLGHAARELRDQAIDKLRDKWQSKIESKQRQVETAERRLDKEKAQSRGSLLKAGFNVLVGLFGKRKLSSSTVSAATNAYSQRQDVVAVKDKIEDLERDIADMRRELEEDQDKIVEKYDTANLELELVTIKPYKKDIDVDRVALLWLPFDDRGEAAFE